MRRNFRMGLILGITLLMLLPVYARAQMSLNNLYQSGSAGVSVVNITATQGDTISFVVTCPSTSAVFNMILNPDPGVATFPTNATAANATFTWITGGTSPAPPGAYTAVFQASYGTDVDQLVVMITINPSTGASPPPSTDTTPPTIQTFTIPGTSSLLTVSPITLSATDNPGGTGVAGYFLWESSTTPSASATGWSGTTAPTSYTFATAGSKTLYAWAKDAAGNVSTSMSASVTITLPSGGGGNFSPLVTLNNSMAPGHASMYGYSLIYNKQQYTIPIGATVYFKVDQIPGKAYTYADISVVNFDQTLPSMPPYYTGNLKSDVLTIDRATGNIIHTDPCMARQGTIEVPLNSNVYYIISIQELGYTATPVSVYWQGLM